MTWLLVSPILIPLVGAALALLFRHALRVQRAITVVWTSGALAASVALLASVWQGGIAATQLSSWPAPLGITFVADLLSATMVVITGVIGFTVGLYALGTVEERHERAGFHPLYAILLMGVNGAFLTGDLFNLFVWFEILLIASFVLLVVENGRAQVRGALVYVTINLIASTCFVIAIGLLYGATGTLNMADIAVRLAEVPSPALVTVIAMLFLVSFGIKAGVFPLFAWLPASYHTPPVAISAVFAGLLTKVGVYALIRTFTLFFTQDTGFTHGTLLLWIAGLTMVTGVLGAAAQQEIRRILSFHIISQIGYMVLGLALLTPLALVGAVFYVVHHIIVKTNLFLVGGIAARLGGSSELAHLGGLYKRYPYLAMLFVVPAFSLAGFPPLSGFWAKAILIKAGLEVGEVLIVVVALVVGALTIYSMTKIWAQAFWAPRPAGAAAPVPETRPLWLLVVPAVLLATITIAIGLGTEVFFQLAQQTAAQLLDPRDYVAAVLGPAVTPPPPLLTPAEVLPVSAPLP
ncbi:MAG: Na+/H+ antiporter subunit D [Rubricoccaceae bacterium]